MWYILHPEYTASPYSSIFDNPADSHDHLSEVELLLIYFEFAGKIGRKQLVDAGTLCRCSRLLKKKEVSIFSSFFFQFQ